MPSLRPKSWRAQPSVTLPWPAGANREAEVGPRAGPQRVWALMCPNPQCDTELIIFPEQAGEIVECPSCKFRFGAPRIMPVQMVTDRLSAGHRAFVGLVPPPPAPETETLRARPPTPADFLPKVAAAADALGALSRLALTAPDAAVPVAVRPQPAPLFESGSELRTSRRVELYPHAAEVLSGRPPRARRSKRADVAIAWTAAGAASAALGLGAWLGGVPGLGLGVILAVGLAVIRTVVVVREKRAAAV